MSAEEETITIGANKLTKEEEQEEEDYIKKLEVLQFKIRKQPDLYAKEVQKYSEDFKIFFNDVKERPLLKNKKFAELGIFLSRLAKHFKTDLAYLQDYIQEFLEHYAAQMNPYLRKKLIAAYMIQRAQNLILPFKALSFLFNLFSVHDKNLRKMISAHIINDLKRMNKHHKNEKINKQVQNYIFEILKKNSDILAKRSLQLMIQMFKKTIWNDTKTINIISQGCFNDYYKVRLSSAYFLIETTENLNDIDTSSDEEEEPVNPREKIGAKKTKAREQKLIKDKKKAAKKQRKKLIKSIKNSFFPIDQLYNPQDFAEKLFSGLKQKNDRFAVKIVMMSLISRLIFRHKLIIISYYSFLQKYCFPHQKEIGKILSYLAEATHELIPQADLSPIIKHIVDNFVNQRCTEQAMTMGLNTIREMCDRNIFCLDKFTLNYLADYWSYKNRNVCKAAKALINLFRERNPRLLERKYRGRYNRDHKNMPTTEEEAEQTYTIDRPATTIDGAELLDDGSEIPIYLDRIMTDEDFKKIRYLRDKKIQDQLNSKYDYMDDEEGEEEEESEGEDDGEEYDSASVESEEEEDNEEIVKGEQQEDDDEDEKMSSDSQGEISEGDEEEGNEDDWEEVDETEEQKSKKLKLQNQKRKKRELEKQLEDFSDWSEEEIDDKNPHGFISQEVITSFRKRKAERKQDERERKALIAAGIVDADPKKHQHTRKEKGGGSTNTEKLKNKPFMMILDKKKKVKKQKEESQLGLKGKIKQIKNQIGHVRSLKQFSNKKKVKQSKQRQ